MTQTKIITGVTVKQLKENTPIVGQNVSDDFNVSLLNHINKNKYPFTDDKKFDVYDLRKLYTILSNKQSEIGKEEKRLQTQLGETIRTKIEAKLGFDPTVRNIINVFTTAAEVFLSVLYQVSIKAKTNPLRTAQLNKFSGTQNESYDYPKSSEFYPWPDYREKDETKGLVDEYLGKAGVLDRPLDVDELEFIDDLLKAFLIGSREDELNQLKLESQETNWFAANPLDTRLMGFSSFPYQRIEGNSYNEIVRLMMIRAMTFFFSNRKLRPEEIQAVASAELDSVLKYCVNEKAVEALGQAIQQTFLEASGMINGASSKVIQGPVPTVDSYYYNYMFGGKTVDINNAKSLKVLPITGPLEGIVPQAKKELDELGNSGNLFLTNYTRSTLVDPDDKDYDGGVYIRMFTRGEYEANSYPTPSPTQSAEIDLTTLKKDKDEFPADGNGAGFNLLSGNFGVQEFFKLNYGSSDLSGLPFRYMFYENSNYGGKVYNKSNGLGLKRSKSKGKDDKPPTSPFDINSTAPTATYRVAEDWVEIMDYIDDDETAGIDLWLTNSERLHDSYGKTRELANQMLGSSDICYPFINFQVKYDDAKDGKNLAPVSLFGSRFYYEQNSEYSKAFLFLHTFPWTGLVTTGEDDDSFNLFSFTPNKTIFDKPEIYNTFGNRAGFISAPRLWVAFIGGLLWRADDSPAKYDEFTGKQIGGGSGANDPIIFYSGNTAFIPTLTTSSTYPTRLQYLTKSHGTTTTEQGKDYPNAPMIFDEDDNLLGVQYKELDEVLLALPQQAKDEFKKVFFDFVESSENGTPSIWDVVKQNLEVFNGNGAQWVSAYNTVTSTPSNMFEDPSSGEMVINYSTMINTYNQSFNNYKIFTPLYDEDDFKYNFILEIDDASDANKMMLRLLDDEIIIANASWKIWDPNYLSNTDPQELRAPITVSKTDLDLYISTILSKLTEVKDGLSASDKKKQREQEIFGTSDENLIKLQLYRTCKNIYDKWIGGVESENEIIFQCGGRSSVDKELSIKYDSDKPKLIDSFRFVSRSFSDIGDKLVINPIPVNDYMVGNPNSSFYDVVTSLLSANNFDFIPLPTYINYNDPSMIESIFKPMSTIDSFKAGTVGPSFVCVYVGQKSKHLDTFDSNYPNDGFDFKCNSDGNLMPTVPKDFTYDALSNEDKVAVFAVNFSQQNQNIFKDIVLDQSEFSETAESLQITDEIASKGIENNSTFGGQNMYNVYSVRSYKAEVEMMGNAMVQPMMYFQLNNIPMFHGAYLITHVKHHLKPNFMSTHFTGVRVRGPETPLLDVSEIFMSLIDTIGSSRVASQQQDSSVGGFIDRSRSYPPIVRTLVENGASNGNLPSFLSDIGKLPAGIGDTISDTKKLLTESIEPLKQMLTEWVAWMKSQGFVGNDGVYARINSAFRSYQEQEEIKRKRGANAARPGTSNHGWGIAIDFQFFKKDGSIIFNYTKDGVPNVKEGYNLSINESLVWLLNNSYRFGWIIPETLRDDKGLEEFWHFEYHGTAANCILKKRPKIKTIVVNTSSPYVSSVKNPKDAKYTDCDFTSVKSLDGSFDSLPKANPNIAVVNPSNDDVAFYKEILNGVNAPHTPENLKFLYAWRAAEGGKAAWNPFNTTKKAPNTTNYNNNAGYPVKNYPTRDVGLRATVDTLNSSYYKKIVDGLKNDIGADKLAGYVDELRTWGTGTGIARVLHGNTVNPPPIAQTTTKIV